MELLNLPTRDASSRFESKFDYCFRVPLCLGYRGERLGEALQLQAMYSSRSRCFFSLLPSKDLLGQGVGLRVHSGCMDRHWRKCAEGYMHYMMTRHSIICLQKKHSSRCQEIFKTRGLKDAKENMTEGSYIKPGLDPTCTRLTPKCRETKNRASTARKLVEYTLTLD